LKRQQRWEGRKVGDGKREKGWDGDKNEKLAVGEKMKS